MLISYTEPVENYLRTFTWNKVKYRADKSVGELIDLLQKVLLSLLHVSYKRRTRDINTCFRRSAV